MNNVKSITLDNQGQLYFVISGAMIREVKTSWFNIHSVWDNATDAGRALQGITEDDPEAFIQSVPVNTEYPFKDLIENGTSVNNDGYYDESNEYHSSSCW